MGQTLAKPLEFGLRRARLALEGYSVKLRALLACLVLAGCASGTSIVTGVTRAPISADQVRLYTSPPPQYEEIGLITAQSDDGLTASGDMDLAVAEIKKRAARIGANGVIIESRGQRGGSFSGGMAGNVFVGGFEPGHGLEGRAIYVPSP